jgi:hypothetical protein
MSTQVIHGYGYQDNSRRLKGTPTPAMIEHPMLTSKHGEFVMVCPTQATPEMPRKGLHDGMEGVVKARVLLRGVVKVVTILFGPCAFHKAVPAAVMQCKCAKKDDSEVIPVQEFNFIINVHADR